MIVVLKANATEAERDAVVARIEALGLKAHLSSGEERTIIGVVGDDRQVDKDLFLALPQVDSIVPILKPFKLASRNFQAETTRVKLPNGTVIGGDAVVVMAGPCAVESRDQVLKTAVAVKAAGAKVLRGGAFKPRSSPYSFQGLGEEGLEILAEAREQSGLPVVTEVMSPQEVDLVARYADILQIGARNMQNYNLLNAVGQLGKPVLLKRGLSSTLEELCLAAEYIMAQGNRDVMLCERGIRTFEKATRSTLDLSAVPVLKEWTHLPVIVDPSHAAGKRSLVGSLALAAVAAGADGLIVEVHPSPESARCDGPQALTFADIENLIGQVGRVAEAIGRSL